MTAPAASTISASLPLSRAATLRWFGLAVILAAFLTRAMVPTTTLPAWDMDPTYYSLSTPALGPGGSMLIDALALLGAAVLFMGESLAGRRVHPSWLLGALTGTVMALLHGWWFQALGSNAAHGTLGNQRIGLAWISGLWAAIAIMHAARDALIRRATAGILLSFVVILALRGVQQVFIDHPITLSAFNADRDRWLAARGWSPDSPMAKAYIRRMSQPEATGWFGLSNVVASFAGFGLSLAAAWLWSVMRPREQSSPSRGQLVAAAAALVASGVAVYLAGSKGGYIAAAAGLGFVTVGLVRNWPAAIQKTARFLGPLVVMGVLAAVILRGLIGERLGELSILFRWFYMQGAARIFAEHPLTGVGPEGFQLAYLTAKNPLNPEEVTSPHSILLDWASTLGVAGLAWAAVLMAMSVPLGRSLFATRADSVPSSATDLRAARRFGMLSLAAATIAASWLETPYITPDSAMLRVIGLLIGCGLVHALIGAAWDRAVSVGLAAGGLAMLAHSQIELTGSNPASCGLFLTTMAIAAGAGLASATSSSQSASPANPPRPLWGLLGGLTCAALAGLAITSGVVPARAWERDLKAAAAEVRPLAEIFERFSAMNAPPSRGPREDPQRFFADLSKLLGRPIPPTTEGWQQALTALETRFLPPAAAKLETALARYPDEWRIAREASRLYLRLQAATARSNTAETPPDWSQKAVDVFSTSRGAADLDIAEANAPRLRARSLAWEVGARQSSQPPQARLGQAVADLKSALQFDPYNLDIALRLFRLSRELNRPEDASRFAAKALELHEYGRLDRATRGLSPSGLAEVQAAAKPPRQTPPPPPSPPPS